MVNGQSELSRPRRAWRHFWRWWPYPLAVCLSMSGSIWHDIEGLRNFSQVAGEVDPLHTYGVFAMAVYVSDTPMFLMSNLLWPALIGFVFYLLVVAHPSERHV